MLWKKFLFLITINNDMQRQRYRTRTNVSKRFIFLEGSVFSRI